MSTPQSVEKQTIAEHTALCLRELDAAQHSFSNVGIEDSGGWSMSERVENEKGRFRLWCGNIGAHQRGRSSLDYRLREASHIRVRVCELLQRIQLNLARIIAITAGHTIPWDAEQESDSDLSDDEHDDTQSCETEIQQLMVSVADSITNLMQLSSAIRNPAPHDLFQQKNPLSSAPFEPFDIGHVAEKFPEAEQFLTTRLGRAISRRRQYLRYRTQHQWRLEQGLDATGDPLGKAESTVASSIPSQLKQTKVALNSLTIDEFNARPYEQNSETSFASSTANTSSLRPIPLPVKGRNREPFECTVCRRFVVYDQEIAWQRHIFRDLQPYVCTFEECHAPDHTYELRHEWFAHEMEQHRKQWKCIEGCQEVFYSKSRFEQHLREDHKGSFDVREREAMTQSNAVYQEITSGLMCPLCKKTLSTLKHYRSHVGGHQRQLSLFALPSDLLGDQDDQSDIGSQGLSSGQEVSDEELELETSVQAEPGGSMRGISANEPNATTHPTSTESDSAITNVANSSIQSDTNTSGARTSLLDSIRQRVNRSSPRGERSATPEPQAGRTERHAGPPLIAMQGRKKKHIYVWQCCACGRPAIAYRTEGCPNCGYGRCGNCNVTKVVNR